MHWRRKLVSRRSPEIAVKRLPISLKKIDPSSSIVPRDSTAKTTKSYLCLTPVYSDIFRSEASSAAAPLTADVLGRREWARVSGIVTSQVIDLPRCHGISVQPSTRLSLPSRVKPLGSFCEGICAFRRER